MLSKKAASKIGYNLSGASQGSSEPLRRSSRGSLEIFGGGRTHTQSIALLYPRHEPRDDALASVGEDITAGPAEPSPFHENRAQETGIPGYDGGYAGGEPGRENDTQRNQVNRWLADVSAEAGGGSSQSIPHSPLPAQQIVSEKRSSGGLSLVDEDLLALLRNSESQDALWEDLRLGELRGGNLKAAVEHVARVEDGEPETSHARESFPGPASSTISEVPPEWEGVLEGKRTSQSRRGSGSGRPPSGQQARQRKKSGVLPDSESTAQGEEAVLRNSPVSNGGGHGSRRTSTETCEVPPEWEGIWQLGQEGSVNTSRPNSQSRLSSTSDTSPEWERVLRGAGNSAFGGRRSSRQSNASATSAKSQESLISERGAQWGYEVKLKTTNGDERLSGSSWISASAMSDDSMASERTAQLGHEVKQQNTTITTTTTTHGIDRLSGSSWISATSMSDNSKSSWTTSNSESGGGGSSLAHAIPSVSKSIKDALSSFQLAFVVCDATDPEYPVLYASAGFFSMTGYSANEVVGRNCRFLQGEYTDKRDVAKIREALIQGKIYTGKVLNYKKDSSPFWNLLTISPIKDDHGKLIKWIGMLAEVEEKGSSQEEKLRAEMQMRIKAEAQQLKSSRKPAKKVEASTQTSISLETAPAEGQESLRRTSYSMTNQSSRYSSPSSRVVSTAASGMDTPDRQSVSRLRTEISKLRQEVTASNANRGRHPSESPEKTKASRFGRLFRKLKGITVTSSKRKQGGSAATEVEAPYEFSDSEGDDHDLDTMNPREAAETARLQRNSQSYMRKSADHRRQSSGTNYQTASESQEPGRASSFGEDFQQPRSYSMTEATGNKSLGQFCVVHS